LQPLSDDGRLILFSLFHLNLAYSSIEDSERPEVARRCYRPLLKLARDRGMPLAIEASGFTLETLERIDPDWIAELRGLLAAGRCELVGSGYAQIIGPLVPADVNRANQRLGSEVYRRLLGVEPRLALVNEQAYSPGLIAHYLEAGYAGIVMEWDNPSRGHPDWDPEWRYYPQVAIAQDGGRIPLLWNHSIAFQKFQRYAHGELEIEDYLDYLSAQVGERTRLFPAYANDAEVFDYRPGRFTAEPDLRLKEWERIEALFGTIRERDEFELVLPGEALERSWGPLAANELRLEAPQEPIPVKKQGKYNVTRWALTGRLDLELNTACYRLLRALRENADAGDADWKELCFLWSSDLRTHITPRRLADARARIEKLGATLGRSESGPGLSVGSPETARTKLPDHFRVETSDRRIEVATPAARIAFNPRRGLAVERFGPRDSSEPWVVGTLGHGYFQDIRWGADFYTGHLVFEGAGRPKVTDLEPVRHRIAYLDQRDLLEISGTVETPLGAVHKRWLVRGDSPTLHLEYRLDWKERPAGRLRLGHVTLNPEAFDRDELVYRTHNGGRDPESFALRGLEVDHSEAISFLVSSSQVLGMTEGFVEIGDGRHGVRVEVDREAAAVLPMITLRDVPPACFCRVSFSAQEMDDTSRRPSGDPDGPAPRVRLRLRLLASGVGSGVRAASD
jgi:hypothetical protein